METVPEKKAWCDALECQIFDIVVDGLKKLNKFRGQVSEDVDGVNILGRMICKLHKCR